MLIIIFGILKLLEKIANPPQISNPRPPGGNVI